MDYRNLTIIIGRQQQDSYPVEFHTEQYGRLSVECPSPDANLLSLLEYVANPANQESLAPDVLRSAGNALYDWLFGGPQLAHFKIAWDRAIRNEQGLRIRLNIDAPEVAVWPWELLCDPSRDLYLATQIATPVVRFFERTDLSDGHAKGSVRLPLKVLFVAPSAPDLDLKSERNGIKTAIAQLGSNARLDVLEGIVTKTRLKDVLYSVPYNILHISGHGGYADGHGYVRLLRDDGSEEFVEDEVLAQICVNARTLRLIVLNVCVAGHSEAGQAFSGLALQILRKGIPAVIAMQFALSDPAAANFAYDFYRYLCRGEWLGRADAALALARSTLKESYSKECFFAAPVFYTRIPDCVIFTLKPAPKVSNGSFSGIRKAKPKTDALYLSKETEGIMSQPDSIDADACLNRWLTEQGLRGNPFAHWNAENEPDLPLYFVDVERFDELLATTAPCVVFAARGCGKTAQRQMLAAQCRPERTDTGRLAARYTYDGFQQALRAAGDDPSRVRTDHHVAAILRPALDALREAAQRDRQLESLLQRPDLAFRLNALTNSASFHSASPATTSILPPPNSPGPVAQLDALVKLLADCGLGPLVILVDGLDEFPLMVGDPARVADFLAPLLGTLPLIERPGLAFKFFLPQEVEGELRRRPWFRADRLCLFPIVWNSDRLQEMLGQRLAHFSIGGGRTYTRLGQLCRPELAGRIDVELVSLAGNLPRAVLALADMLLRTHCRISAPTELIAPATWEEVKRKWETRKADFFGFSSSAAQPPTSTTSGGAWPALVVDEQAMRVWVGDREITSALTAQEFRVLLALYRHVAVVCSDNLLIAEAWPEAKAGQGVTDQAIAATVARLRRQLGQPSAERGYIERVKGRGYRLHPHGFGPAG